MIIKIRTNPFEPAIKKHFSTEKTGTYLGHINFYCQFI